MSKRISLGRAVGPWCLALMVACAPAQQGSAAAAGAETGSPATSTAPSTATSTDPVIVVKITVNDGQCSITAVPDTVELSKADPNKPHSATWTWGGTPNGYEHLFFVLDESDAGLGLCLPSVYLGTIDGAAYRGFGITTSGTNPGAVSRLDTCVKSTDAGYKYKFIATQVGGDPCIVDPKVKILD